MNESKEEKQALVTRIDALVAKLVRIKHGLVEEITNIRRGTWFISSSSLYYQYASTNGNIVHLIRHDKLVEVTQKDFDVFYRQASPSDVERHLRYLSSNNIPFIITVDHPSSGSDNTIINNITDWIESTPALKTSYQGEKPPIQSFDFAKNVMDMIDFGVNLHNCLEKDLKKDKGFDTTKCDFYMVNVGDTTSIGMGSKIRHKSYEQAVTEATRLCKLTGQNAYVVGVVASVNPIKTTKTITVITPQINKPK